MWWWKRTKARPDADELLRQVQEARVRLAGADAEIRRLAAEQDVEQPKDPGRPDGA